MITTTQFVSCEDYSTIGIYYKLQQFVIKTTHHNPSKYKKHFKIIIIYSRCGHLPAGEETRDEPLLHSRHAVRQNIGGKKKRI